MASTATIVSTMETMYCNYGFLSIVESHIIKYSTLILYSLCCKSCIFRVSLISSWNSPLFFLFCHTRPHHNSTLFHLRDVQSITRTLTREVDWRVECSARLYDKERKNTANPHTLSFSHHSYISFQSLLLLSPFSLSLFFDVWFYYSILQKTGRKVGQFDHNNNNNNTTRNEQHQRTRRRTGERNDFQKFSTDFFWSLLSKAISWDSTFLSPRILQTLNPPKTWRIL